MSDFGDAPDTSAGTGTGNYQTLLSNGGSSHVIDTTQTTLFLGVRVDGESDAIPNARAHGDDITTLPDDEDGLVEPAVDLALTVGSVPAVRVRATNSTGANATLFGWIDYHRDGVFDNATERASVAVPSGTNNGTFTLVFPTIPLNTPTGTTYARLRLSSDALAANSTGAASGGEVEDYAATLSRPTDGTVNSAKSRKIANNLGGGPPLAHLDYFGSAVASLGDLDGDGVPDLAVGAMNDTGDNLGAVYVQFMNADGTVKSRVKIASGTNGGPTLEFFERFGSSLASLGDFDGDGITDLAVGSYRNGLGDPGAVFLLMLNANGTVKSHAKIASGTSSAPTLAQADFFGYSVANLGDLDGDGVTDLAVGAVGDDTGGNFLGAVHVLFLNSDGTVKNNVKIARNTNGGPSTVSHFGVSLASLGDFDGDGITDLAVGSDGVESSRGAVYVLLMNANGTAKSNVRISNPEGSLPIDYFGKSVASAGDLDADGVTDLFVGEKGDETGGVDRGALHVLFMNSNATVKRSVKIANGTSDGPTLADGDFFGNSVASLGDLDGDGVSDLAVGAYRDDTGGSNFGAVHVLFLKALTVTDFGDAPDTSAGTGTGNYQTLLANNGPRHDITTTQASLFLGAHIDGEADATPNGRANGDDIRLTPLPDDEDGLVEPAQDLLLTVGSAPVVRVRGTNLTGGAATLYGWIDVNRDGVFDNATERTSASVPAGTNNGTFTLTFPAIPAGTAAGATYARFRLSTDLAAANSVGTSSGGEVEDYAATITRRTNGIADSTKNKKIASDTNGGPTLANGDSFGRSLAPVGDLDGDGISDLAIGAFHDNTGGYDRGAVHVLLLNANGTVKSRVKIASDIGGGPALANADAFGQSVASLGDLDGDGVMDLAVGAYRDDTGGESRGAVHVLFLNADGTVKSSVKIASGVGGGPILANTDLFGWSVASMGDLDGDGVNDLAVGAVNDDTATYNGGAVHVLFLNVNGTVKSSVKIASATNGGPPLSIRDAFGSAVASLGDLDGDGVSDLAVGTYHDNTAGPTRGAVYVLLLTSNGTVKNSVKIASGINGGPALANDSLFGASVSSIGDLDGDGITDLSVGAPGDSTGGFRRGAAHLLLLNANGTVRSSLKIANATNGGPALANENVFGSAVGALGDLDGDGVTEIAVGASNDNTGSLSRGAVHVLFLKSPTTGVTAFLAGNQLVVIGTVTADTIVVDQLGAPGAEVRVLDNGNVVFTAANSVVASAYVTAREGDDSVTIDPTFGARPTILQGDAGHDSYQGGNGNDHIIADVGDAGLGPPAANILGGGGFDFLDFSRESERIVFHNNIPTSGGFEQIFGGSGDDSFTNGGSDTAVYVVGFAGNDSISGGNGNDTLDGVDGDDSLIGDSGDDLLIGTNFSLPGGNSGSDRFAGELGNDTVLADAADLSGPNVLVSGGADRGGGVAGFGDTLDLSTVTTPLTFNSHMTPGIESGVGGFETIKSGSGNDSIQVVNSLTTTGVYLIGGGGDDFLRGGLGNDALQGSAGNDRMVGLTGADTYVGDTGFDVVDYSVTPAAAAPIPGFPGLNGVVADLRAGAGSLGSSGGHAQGDTYLANDVEGVIGTPFNDYIIGNLLDNRVDGLAGYDTIVGNQGNDELIGGLGNDTLIGSDGAVFSDVDKLDGGEGDDRIYADAADLTGPAPKVSGGSGSADVLDFLFSGGVAFLNDFTAGATTGGFEQIFGSSGDDVINTAGAGTLPNLYYVGQGGHDILVGGNGNDTLDGGDGNDLLAGDGGADTFIGGPGADLVFDFNPNQGDSAFGIP